MFLATQKPDGKKSQGSEATSSTVIRLSAFVTCHVFFAVSPLRIATLAHILRILPYESGLEKSRSRRSSPDGARLFLDFVRLVARLKTPADWGVVLG